MSVRDVAPFSCHPKYAGAARCRVHFLDVTCRPELNVICVGEDRGRLNQGMVHGGEIAAVVEAAVVADHLVAQPDFIQPAFSYAILMNLTKWNALSDEQKTAVEAAAKATQAYTAEEFPKATAAAEEKLKENGVTVVSRQAAE